MENWLSVFKGADISKNVLQNVQRLAAVLPNPACGVGIGADGDDFTAQLPEAAEEVCGGQKTAAAVNATGVDFQPKPFPSQLPQNFIGNFPVIRIAKQLMGGIGSAFADKSQVTQHIKPGMR